MEVNVIFSKESASIQVKRLLLSYPELEIVDFSDSLIRLCGTILVYRAIEDYTLRKKYELEIVVPIGNNELPYVIDSSNAISKSYSHKYNNGMLCLETDIIIRKRFVQGFDLIAWMDEYVEPYFVTYEYFNEYGNYPFGERSHCSLGIMESYQELFNAKDLQEAFYLADYIRKHEYRGHHLCICGSGKRLRNCHGPYMLPFYINGSLKLQLEKDINQLERELREYEARGNKGTAK